MADFDWSHLLAELNQYELSASAGSRRLDGAASNWLGFPGASEQEIQAAERRLDIVLPPSYRAFLEISNGWRVTDTLWGRLRAVSEIDWLRTNYQDVIDAYVGPYSSGGILVSDAQYFMYGERQDPVLFRPEYLRGALLLSEDAPDTEMILLNPEIVTADGEWEAWFFAHWLPGASRYRSFWELVEGQLRIARDT